MLAHHLQSCLLSKSWFSLLIFLFMIFRLMMMMMMMIIVFQIGINQNHNQHYNLSQLSDEPQNNSSSNQSYHPRLPPVPAYVHASSPFLITKEAEVELGGPEVSLVSGLEGAGRLWPQETAGARWLGRKPIGCEQFWSSKIIKLEFRKDQASHLR